LAAGERVVLEGTDRLRDGDEVEVVNDSKDVPAGPDQKLQGKPDSKTDKSAALANVEKPNVRTCRVSSTSERMPPHR
ncbi:hypothetical protein RA268_30555, partial [Pseudomonas syringae pv. tagetis]